MYNYDKVKQKEAEILNNINDLEYRLWLLQGEINQALQSVSQFDAVDRNRLNHMEAEICYLQEQVARLKGFGQPSPSGQQFPFAGSLPYGQPLPPPGQPQSFATPKKKDLEKTLGTGIMGIVASVLIFISIIIFGGLLLPYLTDVVMAAVMFLLSFILFGAGYMLLRKDSKNKFHISLCACGTTAVCVSLMFCILLSVFGCSTFLFNRIIPAVSYEKNGFSHSVRSIVFLLLCIVFAKKGDPGIGIYAGVAFVTAYLLLEVYMSYRDALHDGCLFYCLISVDSLICCAIFCKTFLVESVLPYYLTAILLAVFFEIKRSKNSMFGSCIVCLLFLWSGWAWLHAGIFYTILVMLPLFAYGYFKKSVIPLYIGLFSMTAILAADITVLSMFLLWAVPFVCFVVLARFLKNQIFTAVGYLFLMFCGGVVFFKLLRGLGFAVEERWIIAFLAAAVMHILLIRAKAFAEEGMVFEIAAAGMNLCLMFWSGWAVYQEYLNVLTMSAMLGLYTMNTVNLLKKSENFGYYIGLKYTVFMIMLVDAHFELSMLLSVLMLLSGAGSITFGFYKNYKSFRIYGLILSMVSVFKLILFDVSGKSALYNAAGFLVCGLICFGISFLYNKIENRVKRK